MDEKIILRLKIDTEVVETFTKKADLLGIIPSKFVEGCMQAYTEGAFKWADGKPFFVEQEHPLYVSRDTRPVGRPRLDPPPKDSKSEKATPPPSEKLGWYDQDHSKKKLKEFGVMVLSTPHEAVEGRDYLELYTVGPVTEQTFAIMLEGEYDFYRLEYDDDPAHSMRTWEFDYWEFCELCAKRFMAINKKSYRYDVEHLRQDLYNKFGIWEADYQEAKERHDKQNPK